MFIHFLITMIAIYGFKFFVPMLFGIFSLLIPIAGVVGGLFWIKKRKHMQKEKKIEEKNFSEFSKVIQQKQTFWEKIQKENATMYTTRYHNWRVEVWEYEHCQIAYVIRNGGKIARATYYPAFHSIGEVETISRRLLSREDKNKLASIWNLFADQSFKNQTIDSIDEESTFQQIWESIRHMNEPSLEQKMKQFQEVYAELYRYEFRMNQEEKKMWKNGLFLVKQVVGVVSQNLIHNTMQYIINDLHDLQKKLKKQYQTEPKTETRNEWHEMRCVVTTWNDKNKIVYQEYETLYTRIMKTYILSEEEKELIQKGKENIYNAIHNPVDAIPILHSEMTFMKGLRKQVQTVISVEEE